MGNFPLSNVISAAEDVADTFKQTPRANICALPGSARYTAIWHLERLNWALSRMVPRLRVRRVPQPDRSTVFIVEPA